MSAQLAAKLADVIDEIRAMLSADDMDTFRDLLFPDTLPTTEPVAIGSWWMSSGQPTKSTGILPIITVQPQDIVTYAGADISFYVVATYATSYQWQSDSGSGFVEIVGATDSSYPISPVATENDGTQYKCIVTGPGGTAASDSASLTLANPLLTSAGVVGVWPMTDGSGFIAANAAADPASIDNNLYHASESAFTHQQSVVGTGASVSSYAAGPDGRTRANRISWSGSGAVQFNTTAGLFAVTSGQTYTFSFKYLRNAGSDQTFRAYSNTLSNTLTATASWQTWSQTFVASSTTPIVGWYSSGTTPADFLVADVKLELGASSTPYKPPQSHLIFQSGKSPTWSAAGIVTSLANRGALAVRNVDATVTELTYYHAFKQSGASDANYNTLAHIEASLTKLHLGYGGTAGYSDLRVANGNALYARAVRPDDNSWHVMCVRYDGITVRMYLDGVLSRIYTQTGTFTVSYLRFFSEFIQNYGAIGTHGYAAWYDAAHTAAVVIENTEYMRYQVSSRGETFPRWKNVVVCEGDSIFEAKSYAGMVGVPTRLVSTVPSGTYVGCTANSGSTITSALIGLGLSARASIVNEGLLFPASNHILAVEIGTNDLSSGNPETYLTNLKAYTLAAKNAGWKVVIGTILPSTIVGFNAKRNTANAEITNPANLGVYWDTVADQASDPTIGGDAAASNATYYPEGTHPSSVSHGIMEPYWTNAINSLIV